MKLLSETKVTVGQIWKGSQNGEMILIEISSFNEDARTVTIKQEDETTRDFPLQQFSALFGNYTLFYDPIVTQT